ncbi:extracellular solute-binding protein [Clostridiales bacterium COT073_COT-073]|nr:extracellular solute-binding protein [Clostridiales bacterium COT073_COT-073]
MKQWIKILCVGCLAAVMMVGCGPKNEGKQEDSTAKVNEKQTEQTKKWDGVKLVYWSNFEATEPQGIVIKEIVEEYEKETGVEIELEFKGRKGIKEGLIPALDANQQVDLFDGQGNKSNYGERTISLEELVKSHDYEKRTNPVLMKLARSYTDGVLKEIPYSFKANAYLYNKKLFKQAGIENVPENWQEFLDACQKLKDAGIIPLTTDDAYAPQAFGIHMARLMGTEAVTDVVRNNGWKRPEVLKAAKAFEDLASKGYFSKLVGSNVWPTGQNTEFATGKAAMYCVGTYVVNEVKNIIGPDFEWGFFNYPEVEGGINGREAMVLGAASLAITSKCKNPEAAFGLIEKITRGEGDARLAKESLGLPADIENASWPEQLADVKVYFDNCTEIFATCGGAENNPEITPALKENLMKLYAGKITAEEFVENMNQAAK